MKKTSGFICLLLLFTCIAFAQNNPKEILEKCFLKCHDLQGGVYTMDISKKGFNENVSSLKNATCKFLKVEGDSTSPYKFYSTLSNGDGTLCTSNDLVQLRGGDSTGIIYSRSSNQSIYRGAFQSEGLFPPFFQPDVVFSLDRADQSTFIIRQGKDEDAMGKSCYNIKIIDLIRATLPDGQRQEKSFLIDKQTMLPLFYSERSVMKLNNDSVYKENGFRITSLELSPVHDSVFAFKNIPSWFRLRNILETVYHHHLKAGMTAPDFKGKVLGADSISLKSFAGKKVMLFFFYRSSYPSLKALNDVQEFQNTHSDTEVLLIGIDASGKDLKDLLQKRNIKLKAIEDGEPIADKYFVTAAPQFVFVDEKGIIRKIKTGFGEGTLEEVTK
jgi:peroxiredoxin